jgi:hypothetical protein
LAAPVLVVAAWAHVVTATVEVIGSLNEQIAALETQLSAQFARHPDAVVVRSLPAVGVVLGARLLGEFGDDPGRYASAKARKAYAATAPITRASGTRSVVSARRTGNRRLAGAYAVWAFAAISHSPAARRYYDRASRLGRLALAGAAVAGQPAGRHPARLREQPCRLRRAGRPAGADRARRSLTRPYEEGVPGEDTSSPGMLAMPVRLWWNRAGWARRPRVKTQRPQAAASPRPTVSPVRRPRTNGLGAPRSSGVRNE